MSRPWGGAAATAATRYVVRRDHGICILCGHPGANSLDHVHPTQLHPLLIWNPRNWRAAHMHRAGHAQGCQEPGCGCIGNTGRRGLPLDQVIATVRGIPPCTCPCTCGHRASVDAVIGDQGPDLDWREHHELWPARGPSDQGQNRQARPARGPTRDW